MQNVLISSPLCEKCQYFIPGKYTRTSTCSKFVLYKPLGKLLYVWADTARFYENKCGKNGKYFKAIIETQEEAPVEIPTKDYLEKFKDLLH